MIYKFDPQIYPRKVFVAIKESEASIKAKYKYDTDEEDAELTELDNKGSDAMEYHVVEKDGDCHNGVLIVIKDTDISCGTIAHEAVHAAWDIFNDCDIFLAYPNQEPFTYLVGWVVDRIHEALEQFAQI